MLDSLLALIVFLDILNILKVLEIKTIVNIFVGIPVHKGEEKNGNCAPLI